MPRTKLTQLKIKTDRWHQFHILDGDVAFYEPCNEVTQEGLYVVDEHPEDPKALYVLRMLEPETEQDDKFTERQQAYRELFDKDADKYGRDFKEEKPQICGRIVKVERKHFFKDMRYGVLSAQYIYEAEAV